MAGTFTAVIGGIGGGVVALLIAILLVWFFKFQFRKLSNRDSETSSSDPSAVETKRSGATSSYAAPHEARPFRMEELEQATKQFNESNLIGCGTFGLVFKGMLSDGTIVAIKRCNGNPQQEFTQKVAYLSTIRHLNVVKLFGYCQERGCLILVYEYLSNGSLSQHLHATRKDLVTKLEFKQRLSIAIGAAKGLYHLHSLQPPLVHGNFKTANVLVDEDFVAKVADAGLTKLLEKMDDAGSSSSSSFNAFHDPELGSCDACTEVSDVYSFGIFLLELISGKEATDREVFQSNDRILQWVQELLNLNDLVDRRLAGSFTVEGMMELIRLMLKCVIFPGRERPRMGNVASELDQILEKEMTRTTIMGEGTATVILGSQLFTT